MNHIKDMKEQRLEQRNGLRNQAMKYLEKFSWKSTSQLANEVAAPDDEISQLLAAWVLQADSMGYKVEGNIYIDTFEYGGEYWHCKVVYRGETHWGNDRNRFLAMRHAWLSILQVMSIAAAERELQRSTRILELEAQVQAERESDPPAGMIREI